MPIAEKRAPRIRLSAIVLTLLLTVPQIHFARAQKTTGANQNDQENVQGVTRLAETLRLTTAKGTVVPLQVEFKQWHLARTTRGTELPEQGFYIAHLEAGAVVTVIGGKSELHRAGDFWTVDKGARMLVLIKAPQEAVVLQTLAVNPSR